MPRARTIPSGHSYDLILACTLGDEDNAALALRTTRAMASARRGVMAAPVWTYHGSTAAAAEPLGELIDKHCSRGAKVLLCTEGLGQFGTKPEIARYARIQGAVEQLLRARDVWDGPSDTFLVQSRSWQATELHSNARDPDRYSDHWQELACFTVHQLYRLKVTAPLARAVLLSDHVLIHRRCWR